MLPPSALRLRAALGAPAARRPNPAEPGGWKPRPWTLQRRHAEGGDWWTILDSTDRDVVRDEVAGPLIPPDHGDLVRLLDPGNRVEDFWVQTRRGLRSPGRVPPGMLYSGLAPRDWGMAWEGPYAEADDLLQGADGVDPRRLVLAACDIAEAARGADQPEAQVARWAISLARSWARSPSPEDARALDPVWRRMGNEATLLRREADAQDRDDEEGREREEALYLLAQALEAAGHAVHAAAVTVPGPLQTPQEWAAAAALADYDGGPGETQRRQRLAALVRRWIPLPVALLGRLGEPTPLELGF